MVLEAFDEGLVCEVGEGTGFGDSSSLSVSEERSGEDGRGLSLDSLAGLSTWNEGMTLLYWFKHILFQKRKTMGYGKNTT